MKAIAHQRYGSPEVLGLADVPKPTPKDNEVLIKLHATSVTAGDLKSRRGQPFFLRFMSGLIRPKQHILGYEFAGEIEATGKDVTSFSKGDEVFGVTLAGGTNAEYMCLPEDGVLATKPHAISYEQAAAGISGAIVTFQALKKYDVQSGRRVLIRGASGSLGSAAVQLAKHLGADVTAVCSTASVEMVRSLGADRVIDYRKEDYTKTGETYDLILDVTGRPSFSDGRGALREHGVYVSSWPSLGFVFRVFWTSLIGNRKARLMTENPGVESLRAVKEIIEASELKPVIDRRYPLEHLAEAHMSLETGQKSGNVVVTI